MSGPGCRNCGAPLRHTFVDLGMSPLSNAILPPEQLNSMEPFYPLHARVCERCFLVQLEEYERPEKIFGDYPFFSSFSETWLRHSREFAEGAIGRFQLDARSLVVEVASNDGHLLRCFQQRGIPVLGVEPAQNVARAAEESGIPTLAKFFGTQTAVELHSAGQQADLLVANNVLAHVPDLRDFVAGLKRALKPRGTITLEFPHLLRLIQGNQFDTIYHEHFSYFSFLTAADVLAAQGLLVFDVEEIPTHGGSLRVYACHAAGGSREPSARVSEIRNLEIAAGMRQLKTYAAFAEQVRETKRALLQFLIQAKRAGKSVVGYGAPAKGNTLLNYCGVGRDFLDYTADVSPHKQGRYLPGTHIPIHEPGMIRKTRPDYVLILPWNLRDEIVSQLAYIREWGGRFVIPIPTAEVIE
ncbi:MAG TPA: class I SAM-dependent methyltransferase [Candidatus Acidoferrales bacterium]|nr:class I SAM-dependent methyltransferase [Candidatus Acidoferrales bacterium]